MNRLLYVCLVVLVHNASAQVGGQSLQTQLEVNLGPLAVDLYNLTAQNTSDLIPTGPYNSACSYAPAAGSSFRGCMQSILASYSRQGIVGAKIYFGMNGDAYSTPFSSQSGTLSTTWMANLSLFLQDLRAANIRYVSFAPVWIPYSPGAMTIYACIPSVGPPYTYNFSNFSGCANIPTAVFYPWLPFALTYDAVNGQGGPYDGNQQLAYANVPQLGSPNMPPGAPQPWQWSSNPASGSPLYEFFNFIFSAVANAQLQVREFNISLEVPMRTSSVWGRLSYDPVQLVAPMGVINAIMQSNGLSPTAALTTAAFQPQVDLYCQSTYMNFPNSGLVLDEFLLLSASAGGSFGRVDPDSQNHYCGAINAVDRISALPGGGLALVNVHTYPADYVLDNGFGSIPDPNFSGPEYYPDSTPENPDPITNMPVHCAGNGCSQDNSYDIDPGNTSASSETAANMIYTAISGFVGFWNLSNLPVIIGETDAYNPGGVGRDGFYFPPTTEGTDCGPMYGPFGNLNDPYIDPGTTIKHWVNFWCAPDWTWHRPWSSASAGENIKGLVGDSSMNLSTSGLNRPGVVVRPWAPVSWGTILSPAPLSGSMNNPYNVGSCSIQQPQTPQVPASGGPATISVAAPSGCQWNVGPVVTSPPSTWMNENITNATVNGYPCVYPGQAGSNCWGTGSGSTTLVFNANPGPSARTTYLSIAGYTLQIVQPAPGGQGGPAKFSQIGVFRASTVNFIVDQDGNDMFDLPGDRVDSFGQAGDIPIAGDWDGTGVIRIGVFRPSNGHWYIDLNNNGTWDGPGVDLDIQFGNSSTTCQTTSATLLATTCGDIPIVGDWTGTGTSRLGIFRGAAGQFYLDNQVPTAPGPHGSFTTYTFGEPGDLPVAANWNGTGPNDQIGVYRQGTWYVNATGDGVFHPSDPVYYFGSADEFPVVGNWNGTGGKRIGVFTSAGQWFVDINNDHNFTQPPDSIFYFGQSGDLPVVGTWTLP